MEDHAKGRVLFDQAMEFWVVPELERRQAAGSMERPVVLHKAQVVFHPDARDKEVRINDEVRARASIKPSEGRAIKAGDPVYANEIAAVAWIGLPEGEDEDSGHLTMIRLGDTWHLSFDFTYNRRTTWRHLAVADEFLSAAEASLQKGHKHAFVDNLFSAAELAAKALLLTHLGVPATGVNHKAIHARFNQFAKLGNVDEEQRSTFNWLARARTNYRYLEGVEGGSSEGLHERLQVVRRLLASAQRRASVER